MKRPTRRCLLVALASIVAAASLAHAPRARADGAAPSPAHRYGFVVQSELDRDAVQALHRLPEENAPERFFRSVTGREYTIEVSRDGSRVEVRRQGQGPVRGQLERPQRGALWRYELTEGTFAGGVLVLDTVNRAGRLVVRGSGVPVVSIERGALTPAP